MENSKQPAFSEPATTAISVNGYRPGLSKREYIAVMAMSGMLGNSVALLQGIEPHWHGGYESLAANAVAMADALLKALEK